MARIAVVACLLALAAGANAVANDWAALKALCEAGGNEVALGESFDASEYTGQIDFSGVTCVVRGQGQTLDAKGAGRIFFGGGAGSSLEVHGLVLKNGNNAVSNSKAIFREIALNFAPCPGAPHTTSRAEGPSSLVLEILSPMIRLSKPTPLTM
jgi:hypothetical protein